MEKSEEVFTQNPQNPYYFDRIYHTGDMAYRDSQDNLVFVSRQDHQIKHMGHRIELGEIEADVDAIGGINACCCIYVKEKEKIVLFYQGDMEKKTLTGELKERLPRYMLPNAIIQVDQMPLTLNGKRDRMKMKQMYLQNASRRTKRKKEENRIMEREEIRESILEILQELHEDVDFEQAYQYGNPLDGRMMR